MELNIESLTKHYGDLCALEDFTVCLRPGVYGLLGPNGAGKSTPYEPAHRYRQTGGRKHPLQW